MVQHLFYYNEFFSVCQSLCILGVLNRIARDFSGENWQFS